MPGTLRVRRTRRQGKTKFRLHKPHWIDPYPNIEGTEPEKRIFEALIKRNIYFVYQGDIPELEKGAYVTLAIPGYKPDFLLPQYRIILDPFSPFHHSLPDALTRDRRKFVVYTALGYRFIHPWAFEGGVFLFDQPGLPHARVQGAFELLAALPELFGPPKYPVLDKRDIANIKRGIPYRLGPYLGAGANSVAAANKARTRPHTSLTIATGSRRRKRARPIR